MYSWLIEQRWQSVFTLLLFPCVGHLLGINMSSSEIQVSVGLHCVFFDKKEKNVSVGGFIWGGER